MRVIARIPDVSLPAETAVPTTAGAPTVGAAEPRGPVSRPRHRDGILTRVVEACPTWPLAALVAITVVLWMAVSWNEHARLERQRSEIRMARKPVGAPNFVPAGAASRGAVVR